MAKQNKVATNLQQDFTSAEQKQGRKNIAATNMQFRTGSTAYGPIYTSADTVLISDTTHSMNVEFADGSTATYEGLVPIPATGIAGQVLTVTDNVGNYGWKDRGPEFFKAVYDSTTYQEVVDAVDAGKVVILTQADGQFIGLYKYYNSSLVVFDRYYAQPSRGTEFWLSSSDVWSTHTVYTTDMDITAVYTRDRVGTNGLQSADLTYNPETYLAPQSWYDMSGTLVTDTMFTRYRTDKPEVVRFDYASEVAVDFETDPGNGVIVLEFQLNFYYREANSATYVTTDCKWAPKVVMVLSDFIQESGSTYYTSAWKSLNYSVTFDRRRFQAILDQYQNYADMGFGIGAKVTNLTYSGTTWLRQKVAHEQLNFFRH